jgi:hypothetical protein
MAWATVSTGDSDTPFHPADAGKTLVGPAEEVERVMGIEPT